MIRYSQLLYFAEVVDRGSFSAAAKSLFVSQSALSQSVAGLEEALGAELIRRSKNGVRPTYFGQRVYEDARRLIDAVRDCESGWRGMLTERDGLTGQVGIQCTPGAEEHLSEIVVPELSAAYPGIELRISPSPDMRQGFQSFVNGGFDLGVGACLIDAWDSVRTQAEDAGLVCEFFGSEEPQVLLSTRNPLAQGDSLGADDLAQLDLVCYSYSPPPRFLPLFRKQAARVPNTKSVVRLIAVSDTAGVFTPSSIRREMTEYRGRVRLLPLNFRDDAFQPVVHYLIHAPDSALPRPAQRTVELLRHFPYTD